MKTRNNGVERIEENRNKANIDELPETNLISINSKLFVFKTFYMQETHKTLTKEECVNEMKVSLSTTFVLATSSYIHLLLYKCII